MQIVFKSIPIVYEFTAHYSNDSMVRNHQITTPYYAAVII